MDNDKKCIIVLCSLYVFIFRNRYDIQEHVIRNLYSICVVIRMLRNMDNYICLNNDTLFHELKNVNDWQNINHNEIVTRRIANL